MKSKCLNGLITTTLLLLLAGCQTSNVVVDYDTTTNFSDVEQYHVVTKQDSSETQSDPLIMQRVHKALLTELSKKPLTKTDEAGAADLLVRYSVTAEVRSKEPSSGASIGFGSSGRSTGVGVGFSFPLGGDRVVKDVEIIIDFLNQAEKLQWRGSKKLEISTDDPDKVSGSIDAAVREILSFYPPAN